MRLAVVAFSAALCVAAPVAAQEGVSDPWEGFNRDMYAVHDSLDRAVLEPFARGYRAITPAPVRTGVSQFLRNLSSPVIFANDVLQGQAERAGVTAARFGVNTTIGVLGVFDPATSMGLERHDEDFGQTLGAWGVAPGPYLFVPLFGPTNLRDGAGRIVDIAFDPLTWADFDEMDAARATRTVVAGVATREGVIEAVDDLRRNTLDPYATIRTSYGLMRESAIQNGQVDVQDLPDFDEQLDMPEEVAPDASGAEEIPQQPLANPPSSSMSALDGAVLTPTSFAKAGAKP